MPYSKLLNPMTIRNLTIPNRIVFPPVQTNYAEASGGKYENGRLLSVDAVARMGRVSMATQKDATLLIPTRFTMGFMKSMDNRHRPLGNIESAIIGEKVFGHGGA